MSREASTDRAQSTSPYIVLVRDDDSFSEWWKKGEYEASSPAGAVEAAWQGTYHSPTRGGATTRRYRCAVVGPDIGWAEFNVSVEAQPSLVSVASGQGDQGAR